MIYAQPFTQLLHVSARKQLCKRLYGCTHKLYSVASVEVHAFFTSMYQLCLLNKYLGAINNKAQYVVFSSSEDAFFPVTKSPEITLRLTGGRSNVQLSYHPLVLRR